MKRRRKPLHPEIPPVESLKPGDPFNPYRQFVGWELQQQLGIFPKLSAAGKWVWCVLAYQVTSRGYDMHSQAELAYLAGISTRQFRRHLLHLVKLKMAHVETNLGRQNFTWLLFHPAFASCSPLAPDRSVRGGRTETSEGLGQKWPTQRSTQRSNRRSLGVDRSQGTSNGAANGESGDEKAKREPDFTETTFLPITDSLTTLKVREDARHFWYSLSPLGKTRRQESAERVVDRIYHFQQYLGDTDPNIARQARHEVERAKDELTELGFYLAKPIERRQ